MKNSNKQIPNLTSSYTRTIFDHKRTPQRNTAPSITHPDQALTVDEILRQHTKGIPFPSGKVELWEGDKSFFPDLQGLDLSEVQEIKENYQRQLREFYETYAKEQDTAKRAQYAKELQAELESLGWQKPGPPSNGDNSKPPTSKHE